jgi:hypothetical protein
MLFIGLVDTIGYKYKKVPLKTANPVEEGRRRSA